MGTWERAGSGQLGPPTQPRVSMNAYVRPELLNQTTFHPPQPPPRDIWPCLEALFLVTAGGWSATGVQ